MRRIHEIIQNHGRDVNTCCMHSRGHLQPGSNLLPYPCSKIRRGGVVHRDHDHAPRGASKKCRHPLGRIRAPEYDAFTFVNSSRLKLAGELEGSFRYLPVGPSLSAIARRLRVGTFVASAQKVIEIFSQRAAIHEKLRRRL